MTLCDLFQIALLMSSLFYIGWHLVCIVVLYLETSEVVEERLLNLVSCYEKSKWHRQYVSLRDHCQFLLIRLVDEALVRFVF